MMILKHIGKYVGQYVISYILVSMFVSQPFKEITFSIIGALIAISFFASSLSYILGEYGGNICYIISKWSTRIMITLVLIMSVCGIGIKNIIEMFSAR